MNENPVPLLVRDLVYPLWHQSLEMLKDQAESGHFLQSRYGIPLHDTFSNGEFCHEDGYRLGTYFVNGTDYGIIIVIRLRWKIMAIWGRSPGDNRDHASWLADDVRCKVDSCSQDILRSQSPLGWILGRSNTMLRYKPSRYLDKHFEKGDVLDCE